MSDTATTSAKTKSRPSGAPSFESKAEMPKFEIPKFEVPAAFREFADKGTTQMKDGYEKMKAAAEEATDVLEETYAAASKGASAYGLKVIEATRANANSAFDFTAELMAAKSLPEIVELASAHARKQFETLTEQSRELTAIAQKIATDSAEPVKAGFGKGFGKQA